MTKKNNISPLFFWHFFHRIEKELSYERWIDKYKLFLTTLESGAIPYEPNFASFKQFCKILYLQDIRHEERFEKILKEAIQMERSLLIKKLNQILPVEKNSPAKQEKKNKPKSKTDEAQEDAPPIKPPESQSEAPIHQPKAQSETLFFHPKIKEASQEVPRENTTPLTLEKFLHWDEYFPITRRDMVKTLSLIHI